MHSLDPDKLKQLEGDFLLLYPQGFNDPAMLATIKKHRMPQQQAFTQQSFQPEAAGNVHTAIDNLVKAVSRSSMISMFEKPKFKDFVRTLNEYDKAFLVDALLEQLHGNQARGFNDMLSLLQSAKLAKWSLMTIVPIYFAPDKEAFVKPTTAKNIIKYFELQELIYKPQPSWDFYRRYRDLVINSKALVHPSLSPNNAAFTGFLMLATKGRL
ncbi:MAG: hypothetical protein ACPG4U_08475 [Pseudomonadales bacterium]